jgi:transposase-like protein
MKRKRPYYSQRTKKEVVFDYENGRATAKELARLYGILGSNTVNDWVKKYGKLDAKNLMKRPKPNPDVSKEKNNRRQRTYEQIQISDLEFELNEARLKIRLYACALQVASEATGIDLLKKTGELLQQERTRNEL